jgi:hypothetical protein
MTAEVELTGDRVDSSPYSNSAPHLGAVQVDATGQPVNWVLLVSLLGCLSFWGAVVLGIVAAL